MKSLKVLVGGFLGPDEKPSFKKRVLHGSFWSIGGYAANQILRLSANLILTRLLFPQAFGLMALVQVFMTGLEMFSDIGIVPSIVQHQRGEDRRFLDTAWTIQICRGVLLFAGACLLAEPASRLYEEPLLGTILPIVGVNSIIQGFNSTKLAVANRRIQLGQVTVIEIGSYLVSLLVMIGWAMISPTVWSLVAGGLAGSLVKMSASHLYIPGDANRLAWEKEAFQALQRYGKWIFLSTALTFLAAQGDRLLIGRLLDLKTLAFYAIALNLNKLLTNVFQHVAGKAFFPSYAEIARQGDEERLYRLIKKSRIFQISGCWCFSVFLIFWGESLIELLYDTRYADAGWILQLLALGSLIGSLEASYGGVLLATGRTRTISLLLIVQTGLQVTMMCLGYMLDGERGLFIGLACITWLFYPFSALIYYRLSLWQPEVDVPVILVSTPVFLYVLQTLL